ncbi:hypothetical protein C8A01DRAFT_31223 [Parachaetomium inaequale]|uniref:Uncharacterized protein n=1 Tax=Parachaetomium inaequale TaxID=2588326 RepID=A0AAN6PUA6_9PEZI|nr:hypothetical protein C8A01DRAFT_31223 [Parachaetomium inaequale]
MDGPSRTPFPTPQPLGPVRAATSPEEGTPQSSSTMASGPFFSASSISSGGYYDSPTSTSSTASTLLWGGSSGGRKDSTESAPASTSAAAAEAMMLTKRESAFAVSPKHVNANSYCGRHSKEFLFGGKGFGDLWRAVTKK